MSLETPNRVHASAVIKATLVNVIAGAWEVELVNSNGFNDDVRAFNPGGQSIPPSLGVPAFYRLTPTRPIVNDQMICLVGYPSQLMVASSQVARIGPPVDVAASFPPVDDNPEGDLIIGLFTQGFSPDANGVELNTPVMLLEIPRNVTPTRASE